MVSSTSLITQDYTVEMVPIDSVRGSIENDDLYGHLQVDEQFRALVASIKLRGLEEPIIISSDNYIISGHRRHWACEHVGMEEIPVRRKPFSKAEHQKEWHKILAEYNPQRIKSVGALLKESMIRHSDAPWELLKEHQRAIVQVDADFLEVSGEKQVQKISEKKAEFLEAAQRVIANLTEFWPLTVRQIHYGLLNCPPLISRPKRSKFSNEHHRYRNDQKSYNALIELLKQARYGGHVSMCCIDDPTRPKFPHSGYASLSEFVDEEMQGFLTGYHRDRQLDQPRHIEMLGEKGTLLRIVQPVCAEYYVPLTLGRGYASFPVWRDMTKRFEASEKSAMTLIIASDYDPEGLDLADDAIRSLRDLWHIPVDYHRVGVNREQIHELDLASDFNAANENSTRLEAFIQETGGTETWELESLPPHYLQNQIRAAIEANMDMEIYENCVRSEQNDATELARLRKEIVGSFGMAG